MKKARLLSILMAMLLNVGFVYAQDRTISGKVTSGNDGSALPGVSIVVKGSTQGVTTDADGVYKISVASKSTLVFSYVGFMPKEVAIGNRTIIDVQLAEDSQVLDELVVVGYGSQEKRTTLQSVSKISSEEFETQSAITTQDLLQGRAAGVQMTGSSGVVGARANIRIRGVASITGGGEPLYVVDGVPLNDGVYSNGLGAVSLNPLQDLNPNDIESISVLKDASAVAIYGSRGANGVIIITTKKGGNTAKTQVNFDYYTGTMDATNYFDMMNADEYRNFFSAYRKAQGFTTRTSPSDFDQTGFDWPGAVLQTGSQNSYALSARGGDEKTNFYINGSYLNTDAFTIGNKLDRLNGRMNLSHKINNKARVGVNYSLSFLDNDRISSDNSTGAPLTSAYLQVPTVVPFDENGAYVNTGFIQNVLAVEALSIGNLISRRNTGNVYAEYDIIPGLTARTDFGMDGIQTEETRRSPEIVSPGGYGYKRIIQDNKWLNTTTLNYEKYIGGPGGDHFVGVLLGNSFETSKLTTMTVEGSGFVSDALPNVASASTPTTTSATGTEWALLSQFSRVNYRFRDKYLLEGSVRRDGSSRFGANKRFGIFWAASAGWVLSDESFMKDIPFINLLKVKASIGTAGNDRIGNFASLGLYGAGNDYAGLAGLLPSQPANLNLSWEETQQFDVGFTAALFKNRLNIDFDYYIKETTSLLLGVPIPFTTGFTSFDQNIGALENRGIDLVIGGDVIRSNKFTWNSSFNMGYLQNTITDLPADNQDSEGNNFVPGTASQRAIQGQSLNTFYLVRYNGINPQTGDAEWLTKDGEITNSPTANDRVIVGSAIPNFTGGWSNTLTYGGFQLSALFNFVNGNMLMRDDRRFTENGSSSFNNSSKLNNYWRAAGDIADFPRLDSPTARTFAQRSTLQLEDGSFIRLRTATLAYNFPKALLEKTKFLSKARIYLQGQNLLTFAKTDLEPEANGGGNSNLDFGETFFTPPQARVLTAGVNLSF
ncbi:MAG: TonB-linked SusC/RagA family outer membrane protein [Spirosomataceae bacterium]|jgi:TonB-linked SusC/RagA family outer membrane protein